MAERSFSLGMLPASDSFVAFTIIMKRMADLLRFVVFPASCRMLVACFCLHLDDEGGRGKSTMDGTIFGGWGLASER
jgi:hypothetical protein